MIFKFVAGVITTCLLLTLPLSSLGAEGAETLLKEKPAGRDAPLWDNGTDPAPYTVPVIKKISKGIFLHWQYHREQIRRLCEHKRQDKHG